MKKQLRLFLMLGLLGLVGTANRLRAAAVVDQQQPVIDVSVGGLTIGGDSQQKLAQIVTAGISGLLTEVRFPVACESADFIVEIQGVTDEKPNGIVITSEAFAGSNLPSFFPIPGVVSLRSFPFSRPVSFLAGDQFAIVLESTGMTAFEGCGVFQGPVGDSYAGGKAFFDARPNAEGLWVCLCDSAGGRFDLPFQTLMTPPTGGPSLLVTSQIDHTVKEYDGITGAYIRNAATGVGDPLSAIIGADGNVLVTDGQQDVIKRFDRATGIYLGAFASAVSPGGMTMSEDKVYVCQMNPPQVVRSFDAVTGADTGSFVPTVGGGNPGPRDVKIAHGRVYVAYWNLGTVEMFDVDTRQSLGLLFPSGTGGLATPSSIALGPDGNLYVAYGFYVNRYHPTTGNFLGQFVDTGDRSGQRYAIGIAWGPDGNLYVATQNTPGVQRYNGTTGAFMDDFVPAGSGGLTAPFHISFTSFTPVNHPPDCSSARAAVARLWPPDHRLVPAQIVGVTDPDGDPVTITVTGITQDEPVDAPGDGSTSPDGVIRNGTALVRAERSGRGNGRVYVISFTATDNQGASCNGSVAVCVPHDQHQATCIDDGQNYNSLGARRASSGKIPPPRARNVK